MTRIGAIHRPKASLAAARLAFSRAIAAWMDSSGIDAQTLARLCNVGQAAVSKWRNGESMPSEPHLHTLERAGFEAPVANTKETACRTSAP